MRVHRNGLPLLVPASSLLLLTSCAAQNIVPALRSTKATIDERYRGISFILRVDAANPTRRVTIESESGAIITAAAVLSLKGVQHLTLGQSFHMPRSVRATWRTGDTRFDVRSGGWIGGSIVGDYTVPVADRIPDATLDYIRKNGGALRLKIRLEDDGVLIGWDVEERYTTPYGRPIRYVHPGGDFREATILNGKVIDPGWEK